LKVPFACWHCCRLRSAHVPSLRQQALVFGPVHETCEHRWFRYGVPLSRRQFRMLVSKHDPLLQQACCPGLGQLTCMQDWPWNGVPPFCRHCWGVVSLQEPRRQQAERPEGVHCTCEQGVFGVKLPPWRAHWRELSCVHAPFTQHAPCVVLLQLAWEQLCP